jgi:hypothetical protein
MGGLHTGRASAPAQRGVRAGASALVGLAAPAHEHGIHLEHPEESFFRYCPGYFFNSLDLVLKIGVTVCAISAV